MYYLSLIFLLSVGCGAASYTTKHGLNVYCDDVCYEQKHVEAVTDSLIDELVWKKGDVYSYKKIYDFLEANKGWSDIVLVKPKIGDVNSCGSKSNPKRRCKGFKCKVSSSGWCRGYHQIRRVCNGNHCIDRSIITVAKYGNCIALDSLVHELIHFFQYHIGTGIDKNHLEIPFWPRGCDQIEDKQAARLCRANSILNSVNWAMYNKFCGDLNGKQREKKKKTQN